LQNLSLPFCDPGLHSAQWIFSICMGSCAFIKQSHCSLSRCWLRCQLFPLCAKVSSGWLRALPPFPCESELWWVPVTSSPLLPVNNLQNRNCDEQEGGISSK
jgi:hypothetical protein